MNNKKPTSGDTEETHHFGRELTRQLELYPNFESKLSPYASEELKQYFHLYLRVTKLKPGKCRVVCLMCPKKASKNQHHWLIIDETGFHYEFFEWLVAIMGRKEASKAFIREYFSFTQKDAESWSKYFHIHFVRASEIGSSIQYWKDVVIQQHDSDLSFIREARSLFLEIENSEYPKVGFVLVKPHELFIQHRVAVVA